MFEGIAKMQVFGWPLCVSGAVVICVMILQQPLTRLIDRIKSIDKIGLATLDNKLALTGQVQAEGLNEKASAIEDLMCPFDNELVVEQENLIAKYLDNNVNTSAERERFLKRHLASLNIINNLEWAYKFIWGSQLGFLQELNTSRGLGLTLEDARRWYDIGKTLSPTFYAGDSGEYSFEQWLGFMTRVGVILVEGDTRLHITVKGREFLKYIVDNGYSTYKSG